MKTKTYVLRVWQEPSATREVWRASFTNTQTNEKRHFATLDRLTQFLGEEFGNKRLEQAENSPRPTVE
jgi:hypothetical protein